MKRDRRPEWLRACDDLKEFHFVDDRPAGIKSILPHANNRALRRKAARVSARKESAYMRDLFSIWDKVAARNAKRLKEAV